MHLQSDIAPWVTGSMLIYRPHRPSTHARGTLPGSDILLQS